MLHERDELIVALQQLTAFTESLLALNERLVRAYGTDAGPSAEGLAVMRDGVVRWREQLEGFKQRLAAAMVLGDGTLPLQYPVWHPEPGRPNGHIANDLPTLFDQAPASDHGQISSPVGVTRAVSAGGSHAPGRETCPFTSRVLTTTLR